VGRQPNPEEGPTTSQREEEWARTHRPRGGRVRGIFIDHPTVSSAHALISIEGSIYRIKDLGSRNKVRGSLGVAAHAGGHDTTSPSPHTTSALNPAVKKTSVVRPGGNLMLQPGDNYICAFDEVLQVGDGQVCRR
jgi:hypothetical protein